MHDEEAGSDSIPDLRPTLTKLIQYPQVKPDREIAIIRPVPVEVTRPHVVGAVEVPVSENEVIAEGARLTTFNGYVFGVVDGQVRLTSIWLISQVINQIVKVAILRANAPMGLLTISDGVYDA